MLDHADNDVILIVDDAPENLAFLHDALDRAGYKVLVATSGETAMQVTRKSHPDVILLDVLMPGMGGYATAQGLKAEFSTRHIPIIFMTGLTETENVLAAFASGGSDYVTKPIRPEEVLVRIESHLQNAREIKQARAALDAFGQATMVIDVTNMHMTWQTPEARSLLVRYFGSAGDVAPTELLIWLKKFREARLEGRDPPVIMEKEGRRLTGSLHEDPNDEREYLVTLHEESSAAAINSLMEGFHLTTREAEVLYWVIFGKTNRDIGDILGSSHRTIKKHLEHIYVKLGVETRTAAAAMAMNKLHH